MTTTNDAGTLREKITEIVLGVHEAGYYFGSIGERDARNPYTAPEDTAREILAAVAESMLSDEEHLDEFEVDGIPHVKSFNMGIGHVKAKCPSCGVIRNFYGMWGKQEKKNLRWWEVWK
jgi:hypothetical protein